MAGALVTLAACSQIVIGLAPPKEPRTSETALARQAVGGFWDSFRNARYDCIDAVQARLTAAYLEEPRDGHLALLVAHSHLWKVAERTRAPRPDVALTDHLILAERYFQEARRLAPDDDRIPGWLGAVTLALGAVHRDERLLRVGYFMLRDAVAAYPQFNAFSFAYPMFSQPAASPRFAEAVEQMWANVELCTRQRYDRERPRFEYARFGRLRTDRGRDRVCWNTPLAPHNVEGFFLHFGDVLLKNGQIDAAAAAYEVVTQVPEYGAWRFKPALAERRAHLEDWSRRLRDDDPANDPPYMLRSELSCTGCHAT